MTDQVLCERIARSLERCQGGRVRGDDWQDVMRRLAVTDVSLTKFKKAVQSMARNPENRWRVVLTLARDRKSIGQRNDEGAVSITLAA